MNFSQEPKFTAQTPDPFIEFGTLEQDNNKITFFIKDNGAGFNSENAPRLFGAFQRFHNASDFQGAGVGLAIVKRIILRHEGKIWAEGRSNEGAIFYFTLNP